MKTPPLICLALVLSLTACKSPPKESKAAQTDTAAAQSPLPMASSSTTKSKVAAPSNTTQSKVVAPPRPKEVIPTEGEIINASSYVDPINDVWASTFISGASQDSANSNQASLVQLNRSNWTATSNPTMTKTDGLVENAFDGKANTRWTTGIPQVPGQQYTLDLNKENSVGKITLDFSRSPNDYPLAYTVSGSTDGKSWQKLSSGKGTPQRMEITFPVRTLRYIRIEQTETQTENLWWSIHEINVWAEQ